MIITFNKISPKIDPSVFVADGAIVIGDVEIGAGSSIWFNTVVRGDINYIRIGKNTNIQDLSVVHVAAGTCPTFIGDDVTVGHRAIVHACTIGHRCLIGMGAIVMDGAVIGDDCLIAAGSVVTERTQIPARSLVKGIPGKVVREVKSDELRWFKESAKNYYELAQRYLAV